MNTAYTVKTVERRTRNQIRKEAYLLRRKFGLEREKSFPVMEFWEHIVPKIDPLFILDVVEDWELRGRAAETIPDQHITSVKQSVYDAACSGNYWARSVMAHELCHLLLHAEDMVAYAHPAPGERVPREVDPEWQADTFAAELLVPVNLIDEENYYLVQKHFGVTVKMARNQINQAHRVQRRHHRRKKNNG